MIVESLSASESKRLIKAGWKPSAVVVEPEPVVVVEPEPVMVFDSV